MIEHEDDRALANGLLIFGAVLAVGAILMIVLNPVMTPILSDVGSRCTTNACSTGQGWVDDGWTYFPWFVLLLSVLMFIRAATTESRRVP